MPYATQADLVARFSNEELIALTNPHGAEPDAAKVTRAIEDAGAIVDSYLARVYTLPLPSLPPRLVDCCCHLARYALYDERPIDQVQKRFDFEISWLKNIADGRATLGIDEQDDPPRNDSGIKSSAPDRVFTQGSLADFSSMTGRGGV